MRRLNTSPQTPAPLLALIQRANDNHRLIGQKQSAFTKPKIIHHINLTLDRLRQYQTITPQSLQELEKQLALQFTCLDYLFRCHFAMGRDDHLVRALRTQKLCLRIFGKIQKISLFIDERNRQTDKRNSQETRHAPMDRRSAQSPVRKTETTQTLAQNQRTQYARGQENLFSKCIETRPAFRNGQRTARRHQAAGSHIEKSLIIHQFPSPSPVRERDGAQRQGRGRRPYMLKSIMYDHPDRNQSPSPLIPLPHKNEREGKIWLPLHSNDIVPP